MAAFASLAALAALVAPMAASGCGDGAFDAGFHGEPIGRLDGAVLMISLGVAFPENEKWRTGASIVWGGPDGQTASDDRVALALDPERRFHLTLYVEPPAGVFRAAERGSIALGQVVFWADLGADGRRDADDPLIGRSPVLVGWSAAGAGGGLVRGDVGPGLHALRPSAPCAVEPVAVEPLGADEVVVVTLAADPRQPAFFDATCDPAESR